MRRSTILLATAALAATLLACSNDGVIIDPPGPTEGLVGLVQFWEGDFLPPNRGTITPVSREMRVHELTTFDEAVHDEGAFFLSVSTPLVATVVSNAEGGFQVQLPPGRYSVFAVEEGRLYANLFGGQGEIAPVEIVEDDWTELVFDITWAATF